LTAHRRTRRDAELFVGGLPTGHEPEMARIYGFTERIRAILPRHVHTPPRVAFSQFLRDFRADPKHSIAFSRRSRGELATVFLKVSPQGLLFKATLSRIGIFTVIYNVIHSYIEGA